MVMDPLLHQLEESGVGLSVNSFYAAGFLHAEYVRTLASHVSSLEEQIAIVQRFARENFLKLNAQRCEIYSSLSRAKGNQFPECSIDGEVLAAGDVGKCLGYWWSGDQMATKAVEENLYMVVWVFQGDLSALSSQSVMEMCCMDMRAGFCRTSS